jgi:hypothetical protein
MQTILFLWQQIHKQREETIKNMRAITRELLKSFYRKSGAKPANIIMYRDGVGEGHFDIVMRWEGMPADTVPGLVARHSWQASFSLVNY